MAGDSEPGDGGSTAPSRPKKTSSVTTQAKEHPEPVHYESTSISASLAPASISPLCTPSDGTDDVELGVQAHHSGIEAHRLGMLSHIQEMREGEPLVLEELQIGADISDGSYVAYRAVFSLWRIGDRLLRSFRTMGPEVTSEHYIDATKFFREFFTFLRSYLGKTMRYIVNDRERVVKSREEMLGLANDFFHLLGCMEEGGPPESFLQITGMGFAVRDAMMDCFWNEVGKIDKPTLTIAKDLSLSMDGTKILLMYARGLSRNVFYTRKWAYNLLKETKWTRGTTRRGLFRRSYHFWKCVLELKEVQGINIRAIEYDEKEFLAYYQCHYGQLVRLVFTPRLLTVRAKIK